MRFPSPERSQSPALRQGSSSGRSQCAGLPLPPAAGPAWPPCPPGGGSPAPASLAPLASTPALMPRPCPSLLPCDVVAREEPGVLRAASQHLPGRKHTGLQGMRAAPGEEGVWLNTGSVSAEAAAWRPVGLPRQGVPGAGVSPRADSLLVPTGGRGLTCCHFLRSIVPGTAQGSCPLNE